MSASAGTHFIFRPMNIIKHIVATAVAALALISFNAAAQRNTGLPSNYPADGSTPAWFKGCPAKPLVSYQAKTWGKLPDETIGTICIDAAKGYAYANSTNSKGEVSKVYIMDGVCYMVNDQAKTITKIPADIGSDVSKFNAATGTDYLKSTKSEIVSRDLCNYKGRLVEHQTIRHTTVMKNGKEEVGTTEEWVDCEYGISLRHTEAQFGTVPSETYDIVIGPLPAGTFTLPSGYKIIDLASVMSGMNLDLLKNL